MQTILVKNKLDEYHKEVSEVLQNGNCHKANQFSLHDICHELNYSIEAIDPLLNALYAIQRLEHSSILPTEKTNFSAVIRKNNTTLSATITLVSKNRTAHSLNIDNIRHADIFDEDGFYDGVVTLDTITTLPCILIFNKDYSPNEENDTLRFYSHDTFELLNGINPETKLAFKQVFELSILDGELIAHEKKTHQPIENENAASLINISTPSPHTQNNISTQNLENTNNQHLDKLLIGVFIALFFSFLLLSLLSLLRILENIREFKRITKSSRKVGHYIQPRPNFDLHKKTTIKTQVIEGPLEHTPYKDEDLYNHLLDTVITYDIIDEKKPIILYTSSHKKTLIILTKVNRLYSSLTTLTQHISSEIQYLYDELLDSIDCSKNKYDDTPIKKIHESLMLACHLFDNQDLYEDSKEIFSVPKQALLPFMILKNLQDSKKKYAQIKDLLHSLNNNQLLDRMDSSLIKLERLLSGMHGKVKPDFINKAYSLLLEQKPMLKNLRQELTLFNKDTMLDMGKLIRSQFDFISTYYHYFSVGFTDIK